GSLQAETVRKQLLWGMAAGQGIATARIHFRLGISRLYELTSELGEKFTGRTDGPYEIWARCNNAKVASYAAEVAKSFTLNYNTQMREMHDHPEMYAGDYEYRRAKEKNV